MKEVTVTFPLEQFNTIANLLQLICVADLKFHGTGNAIPSKEELSAVWRTLLTAAFRKPMEPVTLSSGQRILTHTKESCIGPCPIHSPSNHHMVEWKLCWRDDTKIFERMCPHGIGHPDPDTVTFVKKTRGSDLAITSHGCENCCRIPQ